MYLKYDIFSSQTLVYIKIWIYLCNVIKKQN